MAIAVPDRALASHTAAQVVPRASNEAAL